MTKLDILEPGTSRGSVLIVGVGAYHGLSAAIARRFAADGYPVLLAGRNEAKLNETAERIEASGGRVALSVGDASSALDMARFVRDAESLAPLTVAVQNVGPSRVSPLLQLTPQELESHWHKYVLVNFEMAKAALPALVARGGTLAFTGASGPLRGEANYSSFAVAKIGLRALAQSLAREFGPQGVHVTHVIINGGIEGERFSTKTSQLKEQRGQDGLPNTDAIAEAYWMLHHQHRSAWTLELDVRLWMESF
ncbi:SDR family oxidoreductase [Rhizobium rhizogenes]|uniref:SDR family NAD(P)-dependent oxidoreductase n=1 Tax=Rhizobium rhizogenes TaxID=359 RepID=UPI003ECFA059